MYLEHLKKLISRVGWKVTKLYAHYTFEQESFKKDFILMNQRSRQTTENSVEENFYKLLNNSNFGNDFRFFCTFVLIFDDLNEVIYLKKYYSLCEPKISQSVSNDLMKQDAEEQYNDAMQRLFKDDSFQEAKVAELNIKRNESLETAEEAFDKKTKKSTKK